MNYIVSPALRSGNIWVPKKINFDGDVISLTPTESTKKINFVGLNRGISIIGYYWSYAGAGYYPLSSPTGGETMTVDNADFYKLYLNPGTLKNMRCSYKTGTNPVGADSCTITLVKNGEDSALTATSGDPSTYEPITFADLVNSVSVADGDYFCVKVASTGATPSAFSMYLEFYRA